jgi:hypothetical protein
MANYAAAPIQPIINGLITFTEIGDPVWTGRGVELIARTAAGAPHGDVTITLDKGLPGDVAIDPIFARTMLTSRPLGGLAGGTTLTQYAITYPTTRTIRIVTSIASIGTDPVTLEVIVWRTN